MKIFLLIALGSFFQRDSTAFGVLSYHRRYATSGLGSVRPLYLSSEPPDSPSDETTEEQKKVVVGNLVAEDEWNGLTMELAELVRLSIVEDVKKNAREFLGKDDYKLGDFSKEVDARVKTQIAMMRDKEEV